MGEDVWTIQAALDWTIGYLERKGDENPRISAQWLLSEATGMSRMDLYTHFDQPLTTDERAIFRDYVKRRGEGEPVQYILGEVGFRYITVIVKPGVLIPRPETEVLVSEALKVIPLEKKVAFDSTIDEYGVLTSDSSDTDALDDFDGESPSKSYPDQFVVADLCTGSGCIACSIAYERPCVSVVATDISSVAVELARQNCRELSLEDRVAVYECDLWPNVAEFGRESVDVIVTNPPYVPSAVLDTLPQEVSNFEPKLALDGGQDGLDLFRRILDLADEKLKSGGSLFAELHEDCLDEAAYLARSRGFQNVSIVYDLTNRPRVICMQRQ